MIHRYPRRLIPKHNFGLINEEIIRDKMRDFYLLRRVKLDNAQPDFSAMLKSQFLPSTFKKGISVVLLSVLRKEDICWCCKKPCGKVKGYENIWIESNRKAKYPKNKHLRYERRKTSYGGYKIGDLYDYESEFPITVKDRYGKDVERKDLIKLKVVHEPVCINFWHFEIMIYRLNGFNTKQEEKISNKEMERIGNLLVDDLVDTVYEPDVVESKPLKRSYYKARSFAG